MVLFIFFANGGTKCHMDSERGAPLLLPLTRQRPAPRLLTRFADSRPGQTDQPDHAVQAYTSLLVLDPPGAFYAMPKLNDLKLTLLDPIDSCQTPPPRYTGRTRRFITRAHRVIPFK